MMRWCVSSLTAYTLCRACAEIVAVNAQCTTWWLGVGEMPEAGDPGKNHNIRIRAINILQHRYVASLTDNHPGLLLPILTTGIAYI